MEHDGQRSHPKVLAVPDGHEKWNTMVKDHIQRNWLFPM